MRLVLAAFAFLFTLTCLAADIDGKWKASIESQNGAMELIYTLKLEEGKLTGSVAGQMGEFPISEGKVDGAEVTFTIRTDNLVAVHKGTLAGDELKLNIEVGDRSMPVVAKRMK